jgi:hypothetical protein
LGQFLTASTLSGTIFWAIYLVIDALFINKRVKITISIQQFKKLKIIKKKFLKPLLSLIKADYVNWKPHKKIHQKEMNAIHALDNGINLADNESTISGFQNKARIYYFQTASFIYFYFLTHVFCLFKGL